MHNKMITQLPGHTFDLLEGIYNPDEYIDALVSGEIGKMSEADTFQKLESVMTDTERAIIIEILKDTRNTELPRSAYNKMPHFKRTPFLLPISSTTCVLDVAFLNNYNTFVLKDAYEPLPPFSTSKYTNLLSKAKNEWRLLTVADQTLSQILDRHYDVSALKEICRDYDIKGFSKGNKQYIIDLITQTFFNHPDEMIDMIITYTMGADEVLECFINENRNTIVFESHLPYSEELFIVGVDISFNALYMPEDVFQLVKSYYKHPKI